MEIEDTAPAYSEGNPFAKKPKYSASNPFAQAQTPPNTPQGAVAGPTTLATPAVASQGLSEAPPPPSAGAFTPGALQTSLETQIGSSARPRGLLTSEQRRQYAAEMKKLQASLQQRYTTGYGEYAETRFRQDPAVAQKMRTLEGALVQDAALDPEGSRRDVEMLEAEERGKKEMKNASLMEMSPEGRGRLREIADKMDALDPRREETFLMNRDYKPQGLTEQDPRMAKLYQDFELAAHPDLNDKKTRFDSREITERRLAGALDPKDDIEHQMDVLQFAGRRLMGRYLRAKDLIEQGSDDPQLQVEVQDIEEGMKFVRDRVRQEAERDPRSFQGKLNELSQRISEQENEMSRGDVNAWQEKALRSGTFGFTDMTRSTIAGLGRLVDPSEGYSFSDKLSDWAEEMSGVQDAARSKEEKESLMGKLAYGAGGMAALIAPTIATGGSAGATRAATVATSLGAEYEGYTRQAMEGGATEQQAERGALVYAPIAAAIELLNPQAYLANGEMRALRQSVIEGIKGGATPKGALKMALESAEAGTKEAIEELSQTLTERATNAGVNKLSGTDLNDDAPTAAEAAETVLVSGILGSVFHTTSFIEPTRADRTKFQAESMQWAAKNPEKAFGLIKGQIPEAQHKVAQERLANLARTYKGNELLDMDPVKAAEVADIVERKNAVEEEIKSAPMDPVLEAANGDPRKREAATLTTDMIEALGIPANKAKAALASSGLEQMPEGTKAITNPDGSVTLEKKPEAGEKKKTKAVESVMTETATEETPAPNEEPSSKGTIRADIRQMQPAQDIGGAIRSGEGGGAGAPSEAQPAIQGQVQQQQAIDEGATAITETPAEATTDPGAAPSLPLDTPAPAGPAIEAEPVVKSDADLQPKQAADGEVIPQGHPDVPQDVQQDAPVDPQQVKKTVATKRAYEGEFREGVKRELEARGLYRSVESFEEAAQNAASLIESIGLEAALEAVRNNDVKGGAAAYIYRSALEDLDRRILASTNPQEIQILEARQAEMVSELSDEALSRGRFGSALGDIYQNSDLRFNSEVKAEEWRRRFGEEPSEEVMAAFNKLSEEFSELKKKFQEAEIRAAQSEEKALIEALKRIAAKEKARGPRGERKRVADRIRSLKIKSDVAGAFIIPPSLYNGIIETVALSVEAGEAIGAAIQKGLKKLRDNDAYKKLSDDDKQLVEQQIGEAVTGVTRDDIDGRLRIPKQMVIEAVRDGANDINSLVAAVRELAQIPAEVSDREIRDAITEYGKTAAMSKDELLAEVRRIKRIGRDVSALEDIQAKKRPLRSGLQRDKLTADERALKRKIRDGLKDLPVDHAAQERELKTALDAAKTRTRNRIEDLQREIDAKERTPRNTKEVEPDAELIALREEKDALQAVHDEVFNDPAITEEERLNRLLASTQRSIEEYDRRISEKNLDPKKKAPVKETPELKALREKRDALKSEYQQLQEEAGVIEKRRLETAKKVSEARIAELKRRIQEGDFSKKEARPAVVDDELTRLNAQKLRLQEEYDKEFYKHELKNRTKAEKAKDFLWEAYGLTRALQATGELSFVLMQGGVQTISNIWRKPGVVARAFRNMWDAMRSEKRSDEWLRRVKSQPWYPQAKEAKLAITEPHAEVTAREELFLSDWTRLIWNEIGIPLQLQKSGDAFKRWEAANPFRALERGAAAYLDTLRVERYLDGLSVMERNGEQPTKQDREDIADAVNTLTGRGSLGKWGESNSRGLAKIFFSPRLWSSTFKTATPYAIYHFGKMTPTARKLAVQDMGRFIGTTMAFVAMAGAYLNNDDDDETGVEMDPRSSDFGKIKIGDRRIDPWGGRIQQVVFSTRLVMGVLGKDAYKNARGEVMPLGVDHRSPTMLDVGLRMATNKLAPSASLLAEFASTKTKVGRDGQATRYTPFGEEYDFMDSVTEKLVPIFAGTVNDLAKEDPGALEGFLLFYAFFGGGVQEYKDRKKETSDERREQRLK